MIRYTSQLDPGHRSSFQRQEPNIYGGSGRAQRLPGRALRRFHDVALDRPRWPCPSPQLRRPTSDQFLELTTIRTKAVRQRPVDADRRYPGIKDQLEKIMSYIDIGEGIDEAFITAANAPTAAISTICMANGFHQNNQMRICKISTVVAVTSFTDYDDAISIANDTLYSFGAVSTATAMSPTAPDIKAGRCQQLHASRRAPQQRRLQRSASDRENPR